MRTQLTLSQRSALENNIRTVHFLVHNSSLTIVIVRFIPALLLTDMKDIT